MTGCEIIKLMVVLIQSEKHNVCIDFLNIKNMYMAPRTHAAIHLAMIGGESGPELILKRTVDAAERLEAQLKKDELTLSQMDLKRNTQPYSYQPGGLKNKKNWRR